MDQEGELFRQALQEEAVTLGIDPIQEQYLMHFAHKSLLSEPTELWKELLDPAKVVMHILNINITHRLRIIIFLKVEFFEF